MAAAVELEPEPVAGYFGAPLGCGYMVAPAVAELKASAIFDAIFPVGAEPEAAGDDGRFGALPSVGALPSTGVGTGVASAVASAVASGVISGVASPDGVAEGSS